MSESVAAAPTSPALTRVRRAILVVDIVESVQIMQRHESEVIERWLRFVDEVSHQVLPALGGRLVKSLGDGLLLEFGSASQAGAAAAELHARIASGAVGSGAGLQLRCGIHVADIVVDQLDIFGSGVNLAARVGCLAGPGQTVISAAARDEIVLGLDAELEDLGECFVKGLDEPVRAFRVQPAAPWQVPAPRAAAPEGELRAMVAVLPFEARLGGGTGAEAALGDWVAEGTILLLSRAPTMRVVSRLSSAAFQGRRMPLRDMAACLGADYVLSGTYRSAGADVELMAELAEGRRGEVVWAERITTSVPDLLAADSQALAALVHGVQTAVLATEFGRSLLQAPPNLKSYSLQLGAISMMHRSGRDDFDRAAQQLQHLIERHPRLAAPRAWLAQWYVLRVTRGLVADTAAEVAQALDQVRRALDVDPNCSLALSMRGFVECHMLRDLDRAWSTLNAATDLNPSDSLAWLFKGVVQSLWGQGQGALDMVLEAQRLSPLDPLRYYYDALSAPAALAAGRLELAAEFAQRSLRANRAHSPTWRALVIAQSELGRLEQASDSLAQLRLLEPGLTVQSYLARSPAGANDTRRRYAEALRRAGLPDN